MGDMGDAVKLVHLNTETMKLEVHHDGKAALRTSTFQKGLAVVSVMGPARGGKSTLINNMLKHWGIATPTFATSSSMSACTSGIWMWSVPVTFDGVESSLVSLNRSFGLIPRDC
jgi:hypothetical protein